jgi:hypothetical protein
MKGYGFNALVVGEVNVSSLTINKNKLLFVVK